MININANDTMTVYLNTVDATGAAVAPSAALAASDFSIYKDGSAVQRASTSGITVVSPFDTQPGTHAILIDTSDNTDAGFWSSGSHYIVMLTTAVTSDSVSLNALFISDQRFGIEYGYMVGTNGANTVTPLTALEVNAEVDTALVDYGANTVVPPTVAQLNARTILSADYFDPAVDTVARVTLVDTTTTNTDMVSEPDNISIAAILTDTSTTIPSQISGLNNLSQANIRTAVGLASANLDTQLDNIPLLTEMTTAFTEIKGATWSTTDTLENIRNEQVVVDTNIDSLISTVGVAGLGLTNLGGMSTGMKAEVNAQCDLSLTDYNPPTRTEATADKDEIIARGNVAWITGSSGGSGNTYYFNAPIESSQVGRNILNVVAVYEGETNPITITGIKDSSDNPIDLSGYSNLNVVITQKQGKVLQSIAHADIAVGGTSNNEITFTNNASVSVKGEGGIDLLWALRDVDNGNKVIVSGTMRITKTATLEP